MIPNHISVSGPWQHTLAMVYSIVKTKKILRFSAAVLLSMMRWSEATDYLFFASFMRKIISETQPAKHADHVQLTIKDCNGF